MAVSYVLMKWKPNYAAAVILPGVQLAESGISLTIMVVQRAKLIEGLSDSAGQQEQLGQERQMGQEITGNLHTKENRENFSENPVPTSPNVSSEVVADSPFPGYLCPEAHSLPVTVRSGLLSASTLESASVFGGQYGGQYTKPSLLLSA